MASRLRFTTAIHMHLGCVLVSIIAALLASCHKERHQPVDMQTLATDIHVEVAKTKLVLPFVALDDHASHAQSFSLDRKSDRARAAERREEFLMSTRDSANPLILDHVSINVRQYGASDFNPNRKRLCALLSRQCSQSVCDDPRDAMRAALPPNRFTIVDLTLFPVESPRGILNCLEGSKPSALPGATGQAVILCPALVFGGDPDEFHTAVVRIHGDLGAIWMVWRGSDGETAEAMAIRQGKAISLFVSAALGENEDFTELQRGMCALRRPRVAERAVIVACPPNRAIP